ncbi:hypothetical protein V6N13_099742 [Hibiscus sabdariffa]|uniref:Uncharacterized protein n=1 Tax=Hibiscus sabdariffa TaxID=183260 RepID=A0ABR2NM23_9ROSI
MRVTAGVAILFGSGSSSEVQNIKIMRATASLVILFGSCEGHLTRGTEQDGYTSYCPHDLYDLHLHKHTKGMFYNSWCSHLIRFRFLE